MYKLEGSVCGVGVERRGKIVKERKSGVWEEEKEEEEGD